MTSELLKYLNEQLGVCDIEKLKSAKNIKWRFLSKNVFVYCDILSNTENLLCSPLCDSNKIQTHNHLVHKQTLNHLAKLAKWLSCVASTCLCEAFDYKLFSCYYEFHSESTLYSCLNAKKLLTWNGCHIWSLSDSNRIQIHKALSS